MRRLLLVGLAAGLGLTACSRTHVEELTMTVAPNTTPCPNGLGGMGECLLVKLDKYAAVSNVWGAFPNVIRGFEHQPSYRYRILVNLTSYSSPIGDPPPPSYSLKQILEKTPDSTIAVPGQP